VRRLAPSFLYPAVVLILNIFIVAKLFRVEYSAYLNSNEGTFIAIAGHVAAHRGLRWWPWWDCGLPFQNTYLPLLHLLTAGFIMLSGHSAALAYHQVSAAFFAFGPVCLYFMAWRMTRQPGASFLAALAYSLCSPCAWLFPAVRADLGNPWDLRRLQVLAYYGQGPHIASLAFLPLAILFLYLALVEGRLWHKLAAGVFLAATVLANAFGAVICAMVCVSLLAVVETKRFWRNVSLLLMICTLTYALISPLLPPSVIAAIRMNSPTVDGDYRFTTRSLAGVGSLVVGFLVLWWSTRKGSSAVLRFFLLFAFLNTGIVSLGVVARAYVVPQPHRYQIAMDMALILLVVFSLAALLRSRALKLIPVTVIACLLATLTQFRHDLDYAHRIIQSVDIATTAPYHLARWIHDHMEGQRVMVSGPYSYFVNDFADIPQLHGGHDPMLPNFMLRIAVYTLYSGMNAGRRDGEVSVLLLKAMGAHAVLVPGPGSGEDNQPFSDPHKFEGLLPVLWREGGDTIYGVPARSASLAHVLPAAAVVQHAPIHGLDTTEIERYVKSIDDPSLPEAAFLWQDDKTAHIKTRLAPGQAISIQVTYTPGWRATINGVLQKVNKDGLGFLLLSPACKGPCEITLVYDGGLEWRAHSLASAISFGGVLWGRIVAWRQRPAPTVE
jgi:energy-converting hydrogenase Eha subunit C